MIGELACGNLKRRDDILLYLSNLERCSVAEHEEVLALVEQRRLVGSGIGWFDAHLLASVAMAGVKLWSFDKPLQDVARRLRLAAEV